MKLQRVDGALYWLPDEGLARADRAVSGPFQSRDAAYLWLCTYLEDRFTGTKRQLWADAVAQLGTRPDPAHLMGVAMMVADGLARETVLRAAQPIQAPGRYHTREAA
jgi:hypothetical protein